MILAGGAGTRLTVLSEERAKPAVPFAGKFRIIDFTISNCVNSGLSTVGILTQYRPHSLNEHIGIGKPWDLDRQHGGIRLLQPYQGRDAQDWYAGTADAILQNLNFLSEKGADTALILSGDHIYKMDYRPMLAFHHEKGADLTIAVMPVPIEEAHRFGIMETNGARRDRPLPRKAGAADKQPGFDGNLCVQQPRAGPASAGRRGRRSAPRLWPACRPRHAGGRGPCTFLPVLRLLGRRRHGRCLLEDKP